MTTTTIYHLVDDGGREYEGSAAEIVARMHDLAFTPAASDEAYMDEVAERAFTQTNVNIDSSSPESFVHGMMQAGLLKPKGK